MPKSKISELNNDKFENDCPICCCEISKEIID